MLTRREVSEAAQAVAGDLAEGDAAIEQQHIGRAQDHAGGSAERHPGGNGEGAQDNQEFAGETRRAGQRHRGHGEEHEDQGIGRDDLGHTAIAGDLAGVLTVIEHAHAEEERAGDHAMAEHLVERTLDALHIGGEDADGDDAHMGDRGIGDELFHVGLRECHQ